jgi:hypothetical protein
VLVAGGRQAGAISESGVAEKEITLDIAIRLRRLLETAGFDVLLTRETDREVPLEERVAFANDNGADVFVSDSAGRPALSAGRKRTGRLSFTCRMRRLRRSEISPTEYGPPGLAITSMAPIATPSGMTYAVFVATDNTNGTGGAYTMTYEVHGNLVVFTDRGDMAQNLHLTFAESFVAEMFRKSGSNLRRDTLLAGVNLADRGDDVVAAAQA